jgi:hypothetical protein
MNEQTMTNENEDLSESLKDLVQDGKIKIIHFDDGKIKALLLSPK